MKEMTTFRPDRRRFLQFSAGVAGAGLVIGMNWSCSSDDPIGENSDQFMPNAWLKITPQGEVTVFLAESEMGQGPSTGLPMIVAEELDVDWRDVRIERASLDPVYGYQQTGGSSSIRKNWMAMRQAGAIAREMLSQAAANTWKVPVADCATMQSRVVHLPSNRLMTYAELIPKARQLEIPESVNLKQPSEFRIVGKPIPRVDIPDKINGKARFGIDTKLSGMQYATITHCPVFNGKVKTIDKTETLKVDGVIGVLTIDEGVVVLAKNTWSAFKGKAALKIDWDTGSTPSYSNDSIISSLKALHVDKSTEVVKQGTPDELLSKDAISSEYVLPFQAHVTMEPMNCTASFEDGKLHIWAPTQAPSNAHYVASNTIHSAFTRSLNKVKRKIFNSVDHSVEVNTTLLGGGMGRRLKQDYVVEAAKIALQTDKPVQLLWTREEDIQHDFYHPLTLHEMRGTLDEDGVPLAWHHTIKGPKTHASGATKLPYNIPNIRVDLISTAADTVPIGPWRAVQHNYTAFAVEHFFDELAHGGKHDPLELRLKLMKSEPRLKKTLEVAADKAGWSHQSRMFGVASHISFGSYVSEIVQLESHGSKLKISKIICVIDCGIAVNPNLVKAQMEGSIIFGLTAALKSSISIKDSRTEQSNYHDYPILRMSETPPIEIVIIQSTENPGGVGEPGVPPLTPALANAVFAAKGTPIRTLPINLLA